MSAGLRVTSQARDFGEIKTEDVLKPVYGVTRTTRQDFDEVVTSKIFSLLRKSGGVKFESELETYRSFGVIEKDLGIVGNSLFLLGLSSSTVDSTRGLSGVS